MVRFRGSTFRRRAPESGDLPMAVSTGRRPPAPRRPGCPDRTSAHEIATDPAGTRVYIGTDCGVAISADGGATWTYPTGAPMDTVAIAALGDGRVVAGGLSGFGFAGLGATARAIHVARRGVAWARAPSGARSRARVGIPRSSRPGGGVDLGPYPALAAGAVSSTCSSGARRTQNRVRVPRSSRPRRRRRARAGPRGAARLLLGERSASPASP